MRHRPSIGPGGMFVEPYAPHEVIGVMHLAGEAAKSHIFRLRRLDSGEIETSLRYRESRALISAHPEPLGGDAGPLGEGL